jgi:cephalosporin-C deacetylase-like acetyl esterase
MRWLAYSGVMLLLLFIGPSAVRGADLDVRPEKIEGGSPDRMMQRYLRRQLDLASEPWKADYEKRKTPADIAAYQARLRKEFLAALGGLPERTPLVPQVTGTIVRADYCVEKVIFQSQPKHYVTALLFLPTAERFRPPYPGVIVPCGHIQSGKGHTEYQSMGALLALSGIAALVFDPIDQGERGQYLGKGGWPKLWGCEGHTMVGLGCVLLGRNTARFEIWDGMRAIDYLQSRPEVDPKRIGCTGNSGGGTQTSYLMALDDRIGASGLSCCIASFLFGGAGGGDSEQNIFGQLRFGMDHADLLMMRAPSPVLICCATQDFFDAGSAWNTFRYVKRLYTRLGFAERADILENDAGHNYDACQREGVARWMSRWLVGKNRTITEPTLALLSEKECRCTPDGNVMRLPGARSVYDLNEDYENELAKRRAAAWAAGDRPALLEQVRRLVGIRKLSELPQPQIETLGTLARSGYKIEQLLIKPEAGISLPALLFLPEKPSTDRIVLYVHQQGKAADAGADGPIERLVHAGDSVLAVDLRGTGQTQQTASAYFWSPDHGDVHFAYILGRSYVGMRAEDILVCARYAAERLAGRRDGTVRLVAVGHVGVPALHAAALEPNCFRSVKIIRTLVSWSNVIHCRLHKDLVANIVHGALTHYDLPNLAATLGDKLVVEQPVNAMGAVVAAPK